MTANIITMEIHHALGVQMSREKKQKLVHIRHWSDLVLCYRIIESLRLEKT